eukprot:3697419-Rhodomonas_salina.1
MARGGEERVTRRREGSRESVTHLTVAAAALVLADLGSAAELALFADAAVLADAGTPALLAQLQPLVVLADPSPLVLLAVQPMQPMIAVP